MALSYKARRRLSLLVLLVGLPAYIVVVVTVMNLIGNLSWWISLPIYVVLGVAWIFPLKAVFMGVGQADPDAPDDDR
ncbi:MAG: DUF2842 domain-containing protein [Thalassovita sp.]